MDSVAFSALWERAVASGTLRQQSSRYWAWDIASGCERPYTVMVEGGGDPRFANHRPIGLTWMDIDVPCRRCRQCLRARARQWAQRARAEMAWSTRTWFVTLTMRPDARHLMLSRARARYAVPDFDTRSPEQQFAHVWAQFSAEITLWMKRVRKNSGAKLRMMCVCEAHADGFPHAHLLVHEHRSGGVTSERHLRTSWRWGFAQAKLAEVRHANYLAKYLAKANLARVRASVSYGIGADCPAMQSPDDPQRLAVGLNTGGEVEIPSTSATESADEQRDRRLSKGRAVF